MMNNITKYLIKQAIPDRLGFVINRPLADNTPNEFTQDDQKTLDNFYQNLPPDHKRVVDGRLNARKRVHSWL